MEGVVAHRIVVATGGSSEGVGAHRTVVVAGGISEGVEAHRTVVVAGGVLEGVEAHRVVEAAGGALEGVEAHSHAIGVVIQNPLPRTCDHLRRTRNILPEPVEIGCRDVACDGDVCPAVGDIGRAAAETRRQPLRGNRARQNVARV